MAHDDDEVQSEIRHRERMGDAPLQEGEPFGPGVRELVLKVDRLRDDMTIVMAQQQKIIETLAKQMELMTIMADNNRADFTILREQLERLDRAVDGIVMLVNGLANKVDELKNSPATNVEDLKAEIAEVTDGIREQANRLAEATVKNTAAEQ